MPDSISPFDRPLTHKLFFNIVYFSLISLSTQEEKVLAIERHRKEQEVMQGRQEEHLDQEREEKRIADQLRDEDRKMAKDRARRREEFRRHRIETERAGEYFYCLCLFSCNFLWQLIDDFTNILLTFITLNPRSCFVPFFV